MGKSFFERLTGSRKVSNGDAPVPPRERTSAAAPKMSPRESEEDLIEQEEEGELTVDIFDDGDNIVVQSIVGGVKPEDVDVQVTDDMLTIRGKRSRMHETRDDNFFYRELYWGAFSRSVVLPVEVVSDEAEATVKEGLLTIRLPKRDRNKAQKLRIKSG